MVTPPELPNWTVALIVALTTAFAAVVAAGVYLEYRTPPPDTGPCGGATFGPNGPMIGLTNPLVRSVASGLEYNATIRYATGAPTTANLYSFVEYAPGKLLAPSPAWNLTWTAPPGGPSVHFLVANSTSSSWEWRTTSVFALNPGDVISLDTGSQNLGGDIWWVGISGTTALGCHAAGATTVTFPEPP